MKRIEKKLPVGIENFYRGMLLWLLQNQDNRIIRSNAETDEGYSDISIETPVKIGIVIEVKYADDGNLEKACKEALRQIEEKKYAEGLKRKGMKKNCEIWNFLFGKAMFCQDWLKEIVYKYESM